MRDIQWSFISLIITSLFQLLLRIFIGKKLGVSGLGTYTLVFTIYMIGMQSSSFGIGEALTKYVAQNKEKENEIGNYVSSGFIGSLVSGSLMGFLLFVSSETIAINIFHNYQMVSLLKITSICFPFLAIQKIVIGTLNGLRKMNYYAIVNIAQNVSIFVTSVILVILYRMNLEGAIYGFVLPSIIIGVVSLIFIRKNFVLFKNIKIKTLKDLFWFGSYVVLANSLGLANAQTGSLLIGHFINEVEVGYYATAITLLQAIIILPNAIQRVTYPTIATYYEKKEYENIIKLIKNVMTKTFIISIAFSILLVILGKILIYSLFTKEFLPAYVPLLILLIGYAIYAPIVSVGGALSGIGKVDVVFKISAISVIINILLNIILIPKLGIIGASIATSLSLITSAMIELYFINVYIRTDLFKVISWKSTFINKRA